MPAEGASPSIDLSTSTIAFELGKLVRGEIRSDPFALSMYATDASLYEIEPLLVVYPRDEEDVRAVAWFGSRYGLPVIPRGAGSGLSGESLGRAIVLDLNIHMARIIELDRQNRTVVVESGVVLDSLNRALRPYGFRIGPDPDSSAVCTVGGMIANNAVGVRCQKYGSTRESLISARAVLSDGTVTNFRPIPLDGSVHQRKKDEEGLAGKINRELPELVKRHAKTIAAYQPQVPRARGGYNLLGVLNGDTFDPAGLLCGSEGTLGIVTEAVLKVEPLPGYTSLAVAAFGSLADAAKAAPAVLDTVPVACELLDAATAGLGAQARPAAAKHFPEGAAFLLVEYEGPNYDAVQERLTALELRLRDGAGSTGFAKVGERAEQEAVWALRKAGLAMLFFRDDGLQPVSVVDEAAVPATKLGAFVEQAAGIFEKHGVHGTAYGPLGLGTPRLRPMLNLRLADHVAKMEKIAAEVHKAARDAGGTSCGGYAEGLARAEASNEEAGKALSAVWAEVKDLFDPRNTLNPGKKVGADPKGVAKNLKLGANYQFSDGDRPKVSSIDPTQAANPKMFRSQTAVYAPSTVEGVATNLADIHHHGKTMLHWAESELDLLVNKMNGYLLDRTTSREAEGCPRFKYHRLEDAAPRAWTNVVRRMMNGRQKGGSFTSQELVAMFEFCRNSRLCGEELPGAPRIGKLAMEVKARYRGTHGLDRIEQLFLIWENFLKLGRFLAPLANTVNDLPFPRWVLEQLTGIDRRRPLPHLRSLRYRHRNTYDPNGPRPKAVLYGDTYTRYHAPEILQSAIDVLEHQGYEVLVADVPCNNESVLAQGTLIDARAMVRKITAALAEYAFLGYPILCLEATDTLCLTQDYVHFVDTPEVRTVARHTQDLTAFLGGLAKQGKLKTDFDRVEARLGYHQPTHHHALRIGRPAVEVLEMIPGVQIVFQDDTCCGALGHFSLSRKRYDEAMWIGRGLFRRMSHPEVQYGLTDSFHCLQQMRHGGGKPALHPVQVLAAAYGFGQAAVKDYGYEGMDVHGAANHAADVSEHGAPAGHDSHADHDKEDDDDHAGYAGRSGDSYPATGHGTPETSSPGHKAVH